MDADLDISELVKDIEGSSGEKDSNGKKKNKPKKKKPK